MTWTDEQIEKLKQLWTVDGFSATQIARQMPGFTRNAVIGKVFRLGLMQSGTKQFVGRTHSTHPRAPRMVYVPRRVDIAEPEAIGELEDMTLTGCKDIKGNPGDKEWRSCGQPIFRGVYCEFHHNRNTRPRVAKKAA